MRIGLYNPIHAGDSPHGSMSANLIIVDFAHDVKSEVRWFSMKDETYNEDVVDQTPKLAQSQSDPEQGYPHSSATGPAQSSASTPARGRSDGITLLAVYHFLLAGLFLLGTVGTAIAVAITGIIGMVEEPDALIATAILGVIATLLMLLTILFLAVGYGLWTRRQWARIASLALAVLSLFAFPIGTFIGGLTIWYLIKPEVITEFEG